MSTPTSTTAAEALLAAAIAEEPECPCPSPEVFHERPCPWLTWVDTRLPARYRLHALAPEVTAWAIGAVKAHGALVDINPYWEEDSGGKPYRCWFCFEAYGKPHDDECAWGRAQKALAAWAALRWSKEEAPMPLAEKGAPKSEPRPSTDRDANSLQIDPNYWPYGEI